METFGLGEGVALAIFLLTCILAAPLPRSVLELLLNLKPNFVVIVAAAATSLVPFLENAKLLYEYRPRNELGAVAFETDPRFLNAQVALLRSVLVGICVLMFMLFSRMASEMVKAQGACKRMEKNVIAMQRQAKSANDATLKMMGEKDDGGGKSGPGAKDGAVEKLQSENAALKERAESATKELAVIKSQAKAFEREHDRLLLQIQELQTQLDKKTSEGKKDK